MARRNPTPAYVWDSQGFYLFQICSRSGIPNIYPVGLDGTEQIEVNHMETYKEIVVMHKSAKNGTSDLGNPLRVFITKNDGSIPLITPATETSFRTVQRVIINEE